MAAEYDFKKNPKTSGDQSEDLLHPRVVSRGTINAKRLAKDLTTATSFTQGDVIGLLTAMEERIADYLKEGYNVKLGEMGYFSIRLKSRSVVSPKEIRATSIEFDNVNFRTSASFKKKIKDGELIRAKTGFDRSSEISQDESRNLLLEYLEKKPFITRNEFSQITNLLKKKALQHMEQFVKEGILIRQGRGTHIYYEKRHE